MDPIMQSAFGQQLHADRWKPFNFLSAENINTIRVVDGGGKLAFMKKSLAGCWRNQRLTQDLERNMPAALDVLSLKNYSRRSLPERADDSVVPKFMIRNRRTLDCAAWILLESSTEAEFEQALWARFRRDVGR